jgi:alanine dehydrogenase
MVFCFQHFNVEHDLLDEAMASGATFVAFEAIVLPDGTVPILAPMSAIAGRLAVQAGAWCLLKKNGGAGVLLPGLDGVPPGKVVILGAGNVGANALAVAHGLGAHVTVFARTERRYAALRSRYPNVSFQIGKPVVRDADLVVAGVLTPGQMSPKLISRQMLREMRRGSALVDVGIDQGGIAETSRPTSHSAPVYVEEGVVHYCVTNMPAAVARTATIALTEATLPYVAALAGHGVAAALAADPGLAAGLNVADGKVMHPGLAADLAGLAAA